MVVIETTDHQNFHFGPFCIPNQHSITCKLLQNSPFFWITLYYILGWDPVSSGLPWTEKVYIQRPVNCGVVYSESSYKITLPINNGTLNRCISYGPYCSLYPSKKWVVRKKILNYIKEKQEDKEDNTIS